MPRLSGVREKARVALALTELHQLMTAFAVYYDDIGVCPNSVDSFCRTGSGSSNETNLSVAARSLITNVLFIWIQWPLYI